MYFAPCLELCSENALFDKSNVGEDAAITNCSDDERQQHADDDEEDGVVVSCGAVEQTLLSLGIKPV